ncbi:MAG TPA: hypothetical protein VMR95_01885 [Candidatus Binatia bacterium]|nr:hypothetical protein [Candidatus Binatia bacterium]
MKHTSKGKRLGIISVAMIPISLIGSFAFFLIFISAPVGIVCGLLAARRGNKTLGLVGAIVNALLIGALVTFMILVDLNSD